MTLVRKLDKYRKDTCVHSEDFSSNGVQTLWPRHAHAHSTELITFLSIRG